MVKEKNEQNKRQKQIKVRLLAHTPNPEAVVAAAAKLCYSNCSIDDLVTKVEATDNTGFIEMLQSIGHESPIEHATFTFGIEGVSRAFLAQITRHRLASYSVQSQRYVNLKEFEYVIPPEIAERERLVEMFVAEMDRQAENYMHIQQTLEESYREAGMETKAAEKKALEDARFLLPNACTTKMVVTMNARSLLNLFNQRCCNRAQWEIRAVAEEMLKQVKVVAPTIFKMAGPGCVRGKCPEGKMSCGKAAEVREKYLSA